VSAPLNLLTIKGLALQGLSVLEIARDALAEMSIPVDQAKIKQLRALAKQKKTAIQIASETGLSLSWVRKWATALGISLRQTKKPSRDFGKAVGVMSAEDTLKRVKAYARSQGIDRSVTVRKATPEELAAYDGLKRGNEPIWYQKWSDV